MCKKSSQGQESERYLVRKISKSHFYFKKNLKKSEGLQGNFSGGSKKNLKKSFFCRKNLEKSLFCRKNLKKSQKVTFMSKKISKSQGGLQLRYLFATQLSIICPGWVAVAVPFCNAAVNDMPRVGCSCGTFLQHSCQSYAQGGLQMPFFSMQQHVRISECCLICVSLKCLWFIAICHHVHL